MGKYIKTFESFLEVITPETKEKEYEASFKKKDSGKLWWVKTKAKSQEEALKKMRRHVEPLDYNLYGGPFEIKPTKTDEILPQD